MLKDQSSYFIRPLSVVILRFGVSVTRISLNKVRSAKACEGEASYFLKPKPLTIAARRTADFLAHLTCTSSRRPQRGHDVRRYFS